MDVRLSPEQRSLQDTARQLVSRLRPETVRDLGDSERAAKLDAAVAASGWRELRTAGDDGAPWASAVEVAIVVEELAHGLADVAFVGPVLAADLRRLGGTSPASVAETVALTADLMDLARAREGKLADPAVAFDTAGAVTALLLDGANGGSVLATVPVTGDPAGADLTRSAVAITASPVSAVESSGARALADDDLLRWTALGLAVTSADLVGTMRGAIELATEYVGARRQFGVPVGSFQAVQHLLADAFVAMEGSSSIALQAAWAVDALAPLDALAAAAAAKAYCARAARAVCEAAIQVHGGVGNTWECNAHVYLRRALASSDLLGGVGHSLERVLEHRGVGAGHGLR